MSEITADLWTLSELTPAAREAAARIRSRFPESTKRPLSRGLRGLLAALCVGACLGASATALAALTLLDPAPEPAPVYRAPGRALDLEWRSYRTPVDVDRMFRTPRTRSGR